MLKTTKIKLHLLAKGFSLIELVIIIVLIGIFTTIALTRTSTVMTAHTHTVQSSRPVYFVHVSSAGGTSLCRMAAEQPCVRVPSSNCNLNCAHPWDWRQHCPDNVCARPSHPCRPPYKPGVRMHGTHTHTHFSLADSHRHALKP